MGIQFDKCCSLEELTNKNGNIGSIKSNEYSNTSSGYISATDSDADSDAQTINTDNNDNNNIEPEYSPMPMMSDDERNKIIKKYKKAVMRNNHLDAMFLIETYNNALDLTNIIFNDGNNVLHYSVNNKNSIFTIFLLQNGLDINIQNRKTGNTPLHISVENNDVRMSAILLKWRANISMKNKWNQTPLDIAMSNFDNDIIDLLTDDDVKIHYLSSDPSFHDYGVKSNKDFENLYLNLKPRILTSDVSGSQSHYNTKTSNGDVYGVQINPTIRANKMGTFHTSRQMSTVDEMIETPEAHMSNKSAVEDIIKRLDLIVSKKRDSIPSFNDLPTMSGTDNVKQKIPLSHANSISHDAINYVKKKKDESIPIIKGWIERKNKLHRYTKKYMCIKDGYMLWNDKKIKVKNNNIVDKTEKAKWKGHISLLFLKENGIKRRDVNKFQLSFVKSKDTNKDMIYQFRCINNNDVSYWINGINKNVNALKGEFNW